MTDTPQIADLSAVLERMSDEPIRVLGLTGAKQSGKDTVAQRLSQNFGARLYQRLGFMDDAKVVVAAMFKIKPEQIDELKLDEYFRISIANIRGYGREMHRSLTMREILQGFGDGCRDAYGAEFYVEAMRQQLATLLEVDRARERHVCYIVSDVRTDAEAEMIQGLGGSILLVDGPEIDPEHEDPHHTENGVSPGLIDGVIDNTRRPTIDDLAEDGEAKLRSLEALDDELALVHAAVSR